MKTKFISLILTIIVTSTNGLQDGALFAADLPSNMFAVKNGSVFKENGKTIFEFQQVINNPGTYYLSFWGVPAYNTNNDTLSTNQVLVNGVSAGYLLYKRRCWQSISPNGQPVTLTSGVNTFRIVSNTPQVPSVDFFRYGTTPSAATIPETSYQAYISSIKNGLNTASLERNLQFQPDTLVTGMESDEASRSFSDTEAPLYDYDYRTDIHIWYSFYRMFYFEQGTNVILRAEQIGNIRPIVECFNASNPEQYAWSGYSLEQGDSIVFNVPVTGVYYVRVRSYQNARSGLCNLSVVHGNNEMIFTEMPIYSMGYLKTINTDRVYNTFTCCNSGDPCIWLQGQDYGASSIYAFNKDYISQGTFDWGTNARIKKQLSSTVKAVLLSVQNSFEPDCRCDVYMGCKEFEAFSSYVNAFPNLRNDDAIQSSPATRDYNCISWSGGITSYWEWPCSELSDYYVQGNPLGSFDAFYASRGLTRTNANASNGVVALWSSQDGFTHASIKKGADANAHGYDWESKLGQLARIFHPRDALSGPSYGSIYCYYKHAQDASASYLLEEEVSDGVYAIECPFYTEEEMDILRNKGSQGVTLSEQTVFNTALQAWIDEVGESSGINPEALAQSENYKRLVALCSDNEAFAYQVYKGLDSGDIPYLLVASGILLPKYRDLLREVKEEAKSKTTDDNGRKIIHTPLSNCIQLVKRILSSELTDPFRVRGMNDVKYSNSDDFVIHVDGKTLDVSFTLAQSSSVSISIVNTRTLDIQEILGKKVLESGRHSFRANVRDNGTYIIQYIKDRNVNVKKINIIN